MNSLITCYYLSLDDKEMKVHNSLVGIGVSVGVGKDVAHCSSFSVTKGRWQAISLGICI